MSFGPHQQTVGQHGEQPEDYSAASRRSLWTAFALISGYMLVEVIGGLLTNSMALLADAGHMVTDALAIGLALLAISVAARPASAKRTFGFQRAEILAALLNALSLWLVAGWIFVEAYRRFQEPPEVRGALMLSVGIVGLLINIAAALVLKRWAKGSLNVEGAFVHILGDLLGSVAVVTGGLLIIAFGWFVVDPIFGVIIGLIILFSSSRLLWKVVRVLMEGTPARLDLQHLCQVVERVEGVIDVHDIHAWSLSAGSEVLSAHVTADMGMVDDRDHLLLRLREIASKEFGISHVTIQLEDAEHGCEEAHHIAHPEPRGLS